MCKTWSLTLKEKRRLRVFENRVLRRIFGPKWNEVTRKWRKLHNEKLNDLFAQYCSGDRIEKTSRAAHVASMGKCRGVYRVLVGKTAGKRPLETSRLRWEENIKMDLRGVVLRTWEYGLDRAGSG